VVATNTIHLPAPYTVLNVVAGITNGGTAPASSTNLLIDYVYFENIDRVQIDDDFPGEPLPVTIQQTSTNAGLRWGTIALTTNTASKIESTTYTEQTTAVQRSFTSSSTADAAAGTGARTIEFTYYDASGNGPYTEIDTLNGTTAVNTVATNVCYVESIVVQTVGSGGTNAGTVTLFTTTGGGGTAIGTIAIGVSTTEWAHHYTPNGFTSKPKLWLRVWGRMFRFPTTCVRTARATVLVRCSEPTGLHCRCPGLLESGPGFCRTRRSLRRTEQASISMMRPAKEGVWL
jgi:hypothetical protein